jgi:hypothetical protein
MSSIIRLLGVVGAVFLSEGIQHEARTDWSMLLGLVFLLLPGAGPRSLDARLARALR